MEEKLKGRLILILGILNVIFLLLWVSSCNDVRKFKGLKDSEMNQRLEAEEKVNDFTKQKTILEEKISKTEKALAEQRDVLESTQKSLSQEQMIANSLKAELEKINKLKEQLEEDLKTALTKGKFAASDKLKK